MNKFEKITYGQFAKDFAKDIDTGIISYDDIKLPKRATQYSAGYDFYMPYTIMLAPGASIKFPTGIRAILDHDKFLAIVPRSGLGFKYRLQLDNTIGIIDADYCNAENTGHIWAKITNDGREGKVLTLEKGSAFAQGIILPYCLVDGDDTTSIRVGGLGSTSASET